MFAASETIDVNDAKKLAADFGLTDREYTHIETTLGRVPTRTELGVFAGMWSEHCSYKSTLHWLKTLPKDGQYALAGPGSHAGVVDVGDGWAVAFKIESHNHPSAVEPFQGALTGVGGILRDIVAQGARPCAVMDSLCFGMPTSRHNRHLEDGVVAGIAAYGNAFGVPNIGGKTIYDQRYEGNILVNALAAGLCKADEMRTAAASGLGNKLVYVGAATGRDGILGAAFASEELEEDTVDDRPHVQVGDPFAGKKLMEACLSFENSQGLVACQDMGACGVTCSVFEMAAAGGVGLDVYLDDIPTREEGMTPQEILLSESQERFMFLIEADKVDAALAHFRSYGVQAAVCGEVASHDRVKIRFHDELFVDLPAELVADGCPPSDWPVADALPELEGYPAFDMPASFNDVLEALLSRPGIVNQEELYSHYDQTVGNRTVRGPTQSEASVLKLPESERGFALSISSRGDLCSHDPFLGSQATLAESARNLACTGAEPIAITDGLNIASPRDPVENKKLEQVIAGLKVGLESLEIPVTGGNVSLYNESPVGPIPPTPMVGSIGRIDKLEHVPFAHATEGDSIILLGTPKDIPTASYYGNQQTGHLVGARVDVDFDAEKKLIGFLLQETKKQSIRAAKDVGRGGLAVALAKLCARSAQGAQLTGLDVDGRADWKLFGETAATAWILVAEEQKDSVLNAAKEHGVPALEVGAVGGERFSIAGTTLDLPLERLIEIYNAHHITTKKAE